MQRGQTQNSDEIIGISNLSVSYFSERGEAMALREFSLSIKRGQTVGIVGESGSGKTTLALSIMRLLEYPAVVKSGEITYEGKNILTASEEELRRIRGKKIAMIFQDPMTSLNPVKRISDHFVEYIMQHEKVSREEAIKRTESILKQVGISSERMRDYPHQFSGGMRQRVMIGLAIALMPEVIIADEPTTSLDVLVEAQIINLLKKLKKELSLTLILITHNMGLVAEIADTVCVMYAGKVAEYGSVFDVFKKPLHPYTKALINSIPAINSKDKKLEPIPGHPPDMVSIPKGCPFNPRCPYAFDKCRVVEPELKKVENSYVSCHLY